MGEYKLLGASDVSTLTYTVNQYLRAGWVALGGPTTHDGRLFQAVTRAAVGEIATLGAKGEWPRASQPDGVSSAVETGAG